MDKMEALKQEIKAKKQELKKLKKSNKTPFVKTKFGNACLSVLSTISKPGVKLHQYVESKRTDHPTNYQGLMKSCEEWLELAEAQEEPNNKLANHLARAVMSLETHPEYDGDLTDIARDMHYQIKRLREVPPDQNLFNHISDMVDQEVEAQKNRVVNDTVMDSL